MRQGFILKYLRWIKKCTLFSTFVGTTKRFHRSRRIMKSRQVRVFCGFIKLIITVNPLRSSAPRHWCPLQHFLPLYRTLNHTGYSQVKKNPAAFPLIKFTDCTRATTSRAAVRRGCAENLHIVVVNCRNVSRLETSAKRQRLRCQKAFPLVYHKREVTPGSEACLRLILPDSTFITWSGWREQLILRDISGRQ